VALRVSVPRDTAVEMITGATSGEGGHAGRSREVLTADGAITAPVIPGLGDPESAPAAGPAFLSAPDTTIFVPPGWSVTFTSQGYGILSREGAT
jgi:N-methylhydantoinase A/oxoprolinase/acetone carboxylase beta subunit